MHSEPLAGRPVIASEEVRAALRTALAPVWGGTLALLEGQPSLATPDQIVFLVQSNTVRVVREATPTTPGLTLVTMLHSLLPDDGATLRDALQAYIAAAFASIGHEAAEAAIRMADAFGRQGGFILGFKPIDCTSRLWLAKPGEDLSKALTLMEMGAVRKAPTLH